MKQSLRKFQKIGNLIEPLIKINMKGKMQSQKHIFSLWSNLVGEEISKKSRPHKLKISKNGYCNILFIELLGPYGPEISLQVEDIKEKINLYYGVEFVSKIIFAPNKQGHNDKVLDSRKKEKRNIGINLSPIPETSVSVKKLNSALATLKENLLQREKQK